MAKKVTKSSFVDRICNLVPSQNTESDWHYEDAVASFALGAPPALPVSKDLREPTWWSINDQENTGSCVGWATADGVVRWHMTKAGRLEKKVLLSPRFVWMASKETDEFTSRPETFIEGAGTSLKSALDVCRKYGTVPDSLLPFKVQQLMFAGNENTFFATAAQRKISGYFNLQKNLQQWKSWIANNGPILAALNVDDTWSNATTTKGKLDEFLPNTVRGGHAIAVVGYTADRFIIRNSWGTSWGDKGFAYASHKYINDAFFNEAYGVSL